VIGVLDPFRATAERGANRDGEEGNGEEGHGEEGDCEEGDGEEDGGEEDGGEEGDGSSLLSARKNGCASSRNAIPSRIHADRARPVGLIVIDSPQVGSPPREGEVLEVIHGDVSVS